MRGVSGAEAAEGRVYEINRYRRCGNGQGEVCVEKGKVWRANAGSSGEENGVDLTKEDKDGRLGFVIVPSKEKCCRNNE